MSFSLPIPAGLLIFGLKFLPIPAWLKGVITAAIVVIDRLPEEERKVAKAELKEAAKSKDVDEVGRLARRYCEGVGCGSDTKGI